MPSIYIHSIPKHSRTWASWRDGFNVPLTGPMVSGVPLSVAGIAYDISISDAVIIFWAFGDGWPSVPSHDLIAGLAIGLGKPVILIDEHNTHLAREPRPWYSHPLVSMPQDGIVPFLNTVGFNVPPTKFH